MINAHSTKGNIFEQKDRNAGGLFIPSTSKKNIYNRMHDFLLPPSSIYTVTYRRLCEPTGHQIGTDRQPL